MPLKDFLFTSESVSEGHPDKMCRPDLGRHPRRDPRPGPELARRRRNAVQHRPRRAGRRDHHARARRLHPDRARHASSASATTTPTTASTARAAPCWPRSTSSRPTSRRASTEGEGLINEQGAGDQGLMFGYACDETPELMPLPIRLRIAWWRRQAQLRKDGRLPFLRPDGKSQVTMRYVDGKPGRSRHRGAVDPAQRRDDRRTRRVARGGDRGDHQADAAEGVARPRTPVSSSTRPAASSSAVRRAIAA